MELIFFTKSLKGLDIVATGNEVKDMGFDGLDLAVRPGYCVSPENVSDLLSQARRIWADMGLSVPMVTTPGEFIDPAEPVAETMLAACAAAGIREVKLGYWHYREPGYWERVSAIRRALEGFARLAEKHAVRVAVHTHSGPVYGLNAAGAMHLVCDLDPRYVGVYLDPGHLAINGEPIRMAIDMVGDHLCLVAAKDMIYIRKEQDGQVSWKQTLVPLREGLVDWPETLSALADAGYDGPLSFHSEYHDVSLDELRALSRDDLAYLRGVLERTQKQE